MSIQDTDFTRDGGFRRETVMGSDAAAMRAPGSGRNDFIASLSDAMRDNPIPAALIGMGALWLFAGGGSMTLFGGRGRGSILGSAAQGAGTLAQGASDMAQGAAHSVGRMGRSVASGVSSTVGGFAEAVSDTAGRMGEYVSDSLHGIDAEAGYRNPRFSSDGEPYLRSSLEGMTSGLQDMLESHPVALGVAGLALGAAVAASLPLTSTEREALGKANETVRSKLGEVAEQARDIASAAAQEVSGASQAHGPG